jgi:hypothetical protein
MKTKRRPAYTYTTAFIERRAGLAYNVRAVRRSGPTTMRFKDTFDATREEEEQAARKRFEEAKARADATLPWGTPWSRRMPVEKSEAE